MQDLAKLSRIGDSIEDIDFQSIAELNLKIRSLSAGMAFLNLRASAAASDAIQNPIFSLLRDLPPHAEYDLDGRHFDLGHLGESSALEVTKNLIEKNQTLICTFETANASLAMESGFAEQLSKISSRQTPLLINFTSSLSFRDVSGLAEIRPRLPLEVVHLGPQYHCSSRDGIDQLQQQSDKIIFLSQAQKQGLLSSLTRTVQVDQQRPVWLRLNLNALASSQGGNSESWPTGLSLQEMIESIELLNRQCSIRGISLGPLEGLNSQSLPARAAAQLLSFFLYAQSYRHVVSEFHGRKN